MSGAEHASLVERVKQLERTDPEANRQWAAHADSLGASRDPAFHDATSLQSFLSCYKSEHAHAAPDPEKAQLVEQIKDWQRTDFEAQRKWQSYCDRNGGGTYDPILHDVAFLQAFVDNYDTIVTGFQPGAAAPIDAEHAGLIERVKELERTDPSAFQKWTSYADTQGGGSRDPARHDKLFLKAFLSLQGQVADHRELKAAMAGADPATVAQQTFAPGGA